MSVSKVVRRFLRLDLVDPDVGITTVEQSPEVAELAQTIKDEFNRRREERRPFELQWRLNQNFIQGNQYCDIIEETGEVADYPALSDDEQRGVYNQIAPIIETRLAKLSRVRPGLTVRPLTSDTDDVMTAKISTKLLKTTFAARSMGDMQDLAANWAEICGSVFWKSVWNPDAGRIIGYNGGKPVFEGDVELTVIPAYEIFPESCYLDRMDQQDSIIHARVYTAREIYNRWHILVEGRVMNVLSLDNSGMMPGGDGYNPSVSQIRDYQIEDAELVLEYYEKPSADFVNGRHVILVGDTVVHVGDIPFAVGDYYRRGFPFVRQDCLKNPGVFWGTSVVERLIPLQREYNAVKNRINEHIARMAVGNPVVEQGSLVNEELLDVGFQPGTVVEYRTGAQPPSWMQVQDIPPHLYARLDSMRTEFIDISGVSEMARTAQAPGSISSGTALEILREQDDTRLSLTAENIRESVRQVGIQWLRLFKQFASTPRVSRVVGSATEDITTIIWDRSDVTSDDVMIDTDNELVNTPAQRKQMALDLINTGMFNDPDTGRMTKETRAKLMEVFQLGHWESAIDVDELQQTRALREQLDLANEVVPRIMQVDDHALHIREHTKYLLSAEFNKIRQTSPAYAHAMEMHLEGHKRIAVANTMALQGAASSVSQGTDTIEAINRDVVSTSTNLKGSQPK